MGYKEDRTRLFLVVSTEKNKRKLVQPELDENLFKHKKPLFFFFTVRVVKQGNRLPGEVLESPALEVFKIQLDTSMIHVTLLWASGWTRWSPKWWMRISRGLIPAHPFCDPVTCTGSKHIVYWHLLKCFWKKQTNKQTKKIVKY